MRHKARHSIERVSGSPCWYCREPMRCGGPDPMTVEHIVGVAEPGGNDPENLRLAHQSCNVAVGSLPAEMKMRLAGNMTYGWGLPEWAREELRGYAEDLIAVGEALAHTRSLIRRKFAR